MAQILTQLLRGVGYTTGLIIPTWLFFAPVSGFHHMISCGILRPVFLDGESGTGGPVVSILGDTYAVIVSPWRLVLSLVLWGVCVFYSFRSVTRAKHVG